MKYVLGGVLILVGIWLLWSSGVRDENRNKKYNECEIYFNLSSNYALPFPEFIKECMNK